MTCAMPSERKALLQTRVRTAKGPMSTPRRARAQIHRYADDVTRSVRSIDAAIFTVLPVRAGSAPALAASGLAGGRFQTLGGAAGP